MKAEGRSKSQSKREREAASQRVRGLQPERRLEAKGRVKAERQNVEGRLTTFKFKSQPRPNKVKRVKLIFFYSPRSGPSVHPVQIGTGPKTKKGQPKDRRSDRIHLVRSGPALRVMLPLTTLSFPTPKVLQPFTIEELGKAPLPSVLDFYLFNQHLTIFIFDAPHIAQIFSSSFLSTRQLSDLLLTFLNL